MNVKNTKIAIIGLGYVGLPLAVAFAEKYPVIGLDINSVRVNELKKAFDSTLEVENDHLKSVLVSDRLKLGEIGANGLFCTTAITEISDCNVFIVTVPTPTDKYNRPVLTPMIKASQTVAKVLKKGDVVVYESTVYPGVTEDEMMPILREFPMLTRFMSVDDDSGDVALHYGKGIVCTLYFSCYFLIVSSDRRLAHFQLSEPTTVKQ